MSNLELWEIVSKPYITAKEISEVKGCGLNKATKMMRDIESNECKNWDLPYGKVPTDKALKRMGLNVKRIYELAKMELELKEMK